MKDLIKKFNMAELNPVSTPMSTATSLDPDENTELNPVSTPMSTATSLDSDENSEAAD
jgi:hypothetical protein